MKDGKNGTFYHESEICQRQWLIAHLLIFLRPNNKILNTLL